MTIELIQRAAYGVAKSRYGWSTRRRSGRPIVVFSMAKTGSSAVVGGLHAAGYGGVHQVHDLDPAFLAREEEEYRWGGRPWRNWDAQGLLRQPPTPAAPWHVVSIVRDPIAQTVSAFFQPGVRRGYVTPGTTVADLVDRFGDRFDRLPLGWFESHVRPTLGIDVYASPFDPTDGYRIIATPSVRMLLLRCEGLAVAPAAIAELTGDDRAVRIPRLNVGVEKDYADLYRGFLEAVRPSPAQIEHACTSQLVQHFYSAVEIDGFRARWSAGTPDQPDR